LKDIWAKDNLPGVILCQFLIKILTKQRVLLKFERNLLLNKNGDDFEASPLIFTRFNKIN
jgi:hypothetical protein